MNTYNSNLNPNTQQSNVYQPLNNDIYSNQQNNYLNSVSPVGNHFPNLFQLLQYQINPYFVAQPQQHQQPHVISPTSSFAQPSRPGNQFLPVATPPPQISPTPQQHFSQQTFPQQTVPVANR